MILIYITLFIIIVFVAAFKQNTIINNKYNNNALLVFLFLLFSISIYNVEIQATPDLSNYFNRFSRLDGLKLTDLNFNLGEEPLFDLLQWLIVNTTGSFNFFLVTAWLIIFLNITFSVKRMFPANYILFVLFSFSCYFIFFSYILNTMRQGLAISFIILAISLLITNRDKMLFYLSIVAAPLFHISALPISVVLLITRFFDVKLKYILTAWVGAIFLFVTNLNSLLFSRFNHTLMDSYTSEGVLSSYSSTNRLDFLLFSVFFGVLFLLASKFFFNHQNKEYSELIKYYLILNTYFLCLGFIGFSDRVASFSWMLIPILIWKVVPETTNARLKSLVIITSFLISSFLIGSMDIILGAL